MKMIEDEFNEEAYLPHEEFLEQYRIAYQNACKFHPRAMKLIEKRKNFIVIAEDEPYFRMAFDFIRAYELIKGRWLEEDELYYQEAIKRWFKLNN